MAGRCTNTVVPSKLLKTIATEWLPGDTPGKANSAACAWANVPSSAVNCVSIGVPTTPSSATKPN